MKKVYKINKTIDFYITLLIGYFFSIAMIFGYLEAGDNIEGYILLTVLMIVSLVSYYVGKTGALITAMISDFVYCTYLFYISFTQGKDIDGVAFFWIIGIPLSAIIVSSLSAYILEIQNKATSLESDNENLVMMDEDLGIKNGKAFLNEIPIYINLNKRHGMDVSLLLVRIKHSKNMQKILGEDMYTEMLKNSSDILVKCVRYEDGKYLLDKNTFAYVLITDYEGALVVKNRMKKEIGEMKFKKKNFGRHLNVEISIGIYTQDEKVEDGLSFIKLAEKELDYDV